VEYQKNDMVKKKTDQHIKIPTRGPVLKIPKKFKLLGQTYTVEIHDDHEDGNDNQGIAQFNKNKIILQNQKSMKRPDSKTEQVYLHEVIHVIFNELHYAKEAYNEQMVDQLASCLHQILTTSEYK
jgi:hypothetical protein